MALKSSQDCNTVKTNSQSTELDPFPVSNPNRMDNAESPLLATSISFAHNNVIRTRQLQDQLAKSLVSVYDEGLCNVTFVCANDEKLDWNGLAYLASMSPMFKARSGEEQHFTVLVPDYCISLLRKLLLLISCGFSIVRQFEVKDLTRLVSDLGVRMIEE